MTIFNPSTTSEIPRKKQRCPSHEVSRYKLEKFCIANVYVCLQHTDIPDRGDNSGLEFVFPQYTDNFSAETLSLHTTE